MFESKEYLVTARKWRPLNFKDVVGQEHITVTLQNAIKTGRIHHAYLFSGPRGVGKTTTARIYARALNCLNPVETEPCNNCESCEAILTGRSMDIIEIDGASNNSVEDVRKLRENAKYPPVSGNYKMYIIDEVHMLSTSAFNALLKTLEEPPPHLLFVFATTEAHKVLPTILSRCQRFDFRRMEIDLIVKHIKYIADNENISIDEEALIAIARKADGSMRDAQSIFDQVVAFCGNEIKYEDLSGALHLIDMEFFFMISRAIREHNVSEMFGLTSEIINRGYDLQECMSGLLEHFRNILSVKVGGSTKLIEGSAKIKEKYTEEANLFSKSDILRFMNLIASTEQSLKFAPQPRIRFELLLVQMANMDSSIEISKLIKELKKLKKKVLTEPDKAAIQKTKLPVKEKLPTTTENIRKNEFTGVAESQSKYETTILNDVEKVLNGTTTTVISNGSADAGILEERWDEFKKQYGTSKYNLFVLTQNDIITARFFNGEIVIQCKNDFIVENLKAKITSLKELLLRFYGTPVNLRIIREEFVVKTQEIPSKNSDEQTEKFKSEESSNLILNKEKPDKSSRIQLKNDMQPEVLAPIEEALIEMFGARQLKVIKGNNYNA